VANACRSKRTCTTSWHRLGALDFPVRDAHQRARRRALIGVGREPADHRCKTEDYSSLVAAGGAFLVGSALFLGLSIYCFATSTSSVTIVDTNGNAIAKRVPTFAFGRDVSVF